MVSSRTFIFWTVVAAMAGPWSRVSWGGAPIPPEKRIATTVVGKLTAPADQPMHMPTDVALARTGRVFVADGANDRIVVFRPDGAFEKAFSKIGNETLSRPVGLTVDSADRLWVADTGNHRILIAAPDGTLAEQIGLPGIEGGKLFDVTDVVVTADGKRSYMVDNENHRLAIRDNAAGTITFLGKFGPALGQFRWPFTVALAPDGYVYICEAIGARVQRLSPTDRWAGQVGLWGVELGQLYRPKGIVVDGNGRLYVGDSSLNVVQVFGPRGGIEGVLTDATGKPMRFAHPMGMSFDRAGNLYLVELKENRVTILKLPPGYVPAAQPPGSAPATQPADKTTNAEGKAR